MPQRAGKILITLGIFAFAGAVITVAGFLISNFINQPASVSLVDSGQKRDGASSVESIEDIIRRARERSENVKGVYVTSVVASDPGKAASKLRSDILKLLETTELNGVVIDVKEADGVFLPESLKDFIAELREKDVWVIARIVAFSDSARAQTNPEDALKRANGKLWLDQRGNAWLDPASREVWDYILGVAKKAADYGFDEIQFDYIRFPSDGDVGGIVYPAFSAKEQKKHEALRDFFQYTSILLKAHRPELILSADLFGYVAIQQSDLGIGQRMEDIGDSFDYISFMLYPSHYYSGFQIGEDSARELPALYYPYRSADRNKAAASHPYEVVYRSLLVASDFLAGMDVFNAATSTPGTIEATSTVPELALKPRSNAKLRPWLQDFDLRFDTGRGIYYDAEKVRAQIDAAEAAGASGWLLWNPGNVYTEEALKKE